MYFGTEPYDLEGYIENSGDGSNMYRGETFGQPRTMRDGDVLAGGLVVAGELFEGGNGGVGLRLADGSERVVAARIPLLLEGGGYGKVPSQLTVGDILENGDVVLAPSEELAEDNPEFERHRREVKIHLPGGLRGSSITVPGDLVIALHNETYLPSPDSRLGAFVFKRTMSMGARARRNLPYHGRLDHEPEPQRLARVFSQIGASRRKGQEEMAAYRETVAALTRRCEELKGVELLITGQLQGRGGQRVGADEPGSWVEDLHIEVTSAAVNSSGNFQTKEQTPFIEFYGFTLEGNELVGAWLDVGVSGVTAKIFEPSDPSPSIKR